MVAVMKMKKLDPAEIERHGRRRRYDRREPYLPESSSRMDMIRGWRAHLLAACVAGVTVISAPAAATDFDAAAVDALMRRLMSADAVPGAALALIKDGRIVLERGYVFRDLASHAPVTTAT